MTTIRVSKDKNYSVINNTVLNDERLSWKAKGMAAYLLSKPDDWEIVRENLINQSNDGITSVRSALQELEECGYLVRTRRQDEHGRFVWERTLYETPQPVTAKPSVDKPLVENPPVDKPPVDKPTVDNEPLLNTEVVNTDPPNTETARGLGDRASTAPPPSPTPQHAPPPKPPPGLIKSEQPTNKTITVVSAHLDARRFVNGYIPTGAGQNAVEVYYERFAINNADHRLSHPLEDDLIHYCPDLPRLRAVIEAYSRHKNYRSGNIQLILDWYANGVPGAPDKQNSGYTNNRPLSKGELTSQAFAEIQAMLDKEAVADE